MILENGITYEEQTLTLHWTGNTHRRMAGHRCSVAPAGGGQKDVRRQADGATVRGSRTCASIEPQSRSIGEERRLASGMDKDNPLIS